MSCALLPDNKVLILLYMDDSQTYCICVAHIFYCNFANFNLLTAISYIDINFIFIYNLYMRLVRRYSKVIRVKGAKRFKWQ